MEALGGKHSQGQSPVSAAAVAALRKLGREYRATDGLQGNERAIAVRRVLLDNADSPERRKSYEEIFRENGLSY